MDIEVDVGMDVGLSFGLNVGVDVVIDVGVDVGYSIFIHYFLMEHVSCFGVSLGRACRACRLLRIMHSFILFLVALIVINILFFYTTRRSVSLFCCGHEPAINPRTGLVLDLDVGNLLDQWFAKLSGPHSVS